MSVINVFHKKKKHDMLYIITDKLSLNYYELPLHQSLEHTSPLPVISLLAFKN